MAIHQCPHCDLESTHRWVIKRHMKAKHGVAQAEVERSVKPQHHEDTFSEASTYDSQSKNEEDMFDRLSTDESESEDERYSWELDAIFEGAYNNFLEFAGSCEIADAYFKKNWKYMTQGSKKRAMAKYAKLKMKMIEVYIGLPYSDDDTGEEENSKSSQEEKSEGENSEGEKSEGENSEGEKSEDESSEADGDACTCFLSIINDFEDVLSDKESGRLKQYEDEAVDEIIEEEEWDVQADHSEVESEDGESYERAYLQTQEKDLKTLKQGFKEQGEGYFQYCSRREITTLCRWCNYILREKYDTDERHWERFMEKCHPHMCNIKEIAYGWKPRYEKRRCLQKNQLGTVIVKGMLPLIQDTIKSLLQSM